MDLDLLYRLVTEAIQRADVLDDLRAPGAAEAHLDVSFLEERIADSLPASDPEGELARRGAVRAAGAAGDLKRAQDLVERFRADSDASDDLRQQLTDLLGRHPTLGVRASVSDGSNITLDGVAPDGFALTDIMLGQADPSVVKGTWWDYDNGELQVIVSDALVGALRPSRP